MLLRSVVKEHFSEPQIKRPTMKKHESEKRFLCVLCAFPVDILRQILFCQPWRTRRTRRRMNPVSVKAFFFIRNSPVFLRVLCALRGCPSFFKPYSQMEIRSMPSFGYLGTPCRTVSPNNLLLRLSRIAVSETENAPFVEAGSFAVYSS